MSQPVVQKKDYLKMLDVVLVSSSGSLVLFSNSESSFPLSHLIRVLLLSVFSQLLNLLVSASLSELAVHETR